MYESTWDEIVNEGSTLNADYTRWADHNAEGDIVIIRQPVAVRVA